MADISARARTTPFPTQLALPRFARLDLRSPYLLLFLILFVSYSYVFPRWADWNQNSRFDLTRAIVEQGTLRIDDYASNTGDYATIDGHIYSDKAPGVSLIAVPVYGIVHVVRPLGPGWVAERIGEREAFTRTLNPDGAGTNADRVYQAFALWMVTLVCVAIPAALAGVLLARMTERICGCRTAGIGAALIVGVATPVFTYAQAFYGHIPAAVCIVGALALLVLRDGELSNRRLLGVGVLLGLAVLIEYPSAVVGLPVALYAVLLERRRAVLYGIAGALAPLAVLALYDLLAFGTPLPIGYEHSTLWQEQHQQGFLSLSSPTWTAFWGLTGGSFRGLFFFAPVLLLALPGVILGLRDRAARLPIAVVAAGFGGMLLFASSSAMWWGGFAVGPRYVLPAVPLLALPLGMTIAWVNRAALPVRLAGFIVTLGLTGISVVMTWGLTLAGQGYPPDTIRDPLVDYVWPAFRDGDVARNAGMVFGLSGVATLVPLVLVLAVGMLLLVRALSDEAAVAA